MFGEGDRAAGTVGVGVLVVMFFALGSVFPVVLSYLRNYLGCASYNPF